MQILSPRSSSAPFLALVLAPLVLAPLAPAFQDRLKTMPGYERYQQVGKKIQGTLKSGALSVEWQEDGQSFEFRRDGKSWRCAASSGELSEAPPAAKEKDKDSRARGEGRPRRGGSAPERGRQWSSALSPDGQHKAACKDRNLWIGDAEGKNEIAVTTDGSVEKRIKNAVASWVYGEELDQTTAMWWSPDSTQIAFYRFDETKVPDFYLGMDQTKVQDKLDTEAYPKAGAPNPEVEILVYDLASRRLSRVDIRDGRPLTDEVVGHYAYNVSWSADSKELLFNRTNRRQNVMEF